MPESNPITPDANSNITLSTLVEVLADTELEIGKTSDYHPTSGRVLKDSEDETIYLADGTSWNDVSSAIGVDTPRTQTDEATTEILSYDYSDEWPHSPRMPEVGGPPNFGPYPNVDHPVISPDQVTDQTVDNVADPFSAVDFNGDSNNLFHVFAEIFDETNSDFFIAHWASDDALSWTYDQVVISHADISHNPSYPYTFFHGGEWHILLGDTGDGRVEVYKPNTFPSDWNTTPAANLLSSHTDGAYGDPTLFFFDGKWWLAVHDTNPDKYLYYADSPLGPYTAHPNNPVVTSNALARNGGRPITTPDRVFMFCRDGVDVTSESARVRTLVITDLTTTSFSATEADNSPILRASSNVNAFNRNAMHHVDPLISRVTNRDIVIVDGNGNAPGGGADDYSVTAYTTGRQPVLARATLSSDTNITGNNAINDLTFDNAKIDYGQNLGDNGKFTAPVSGFYEFKYQVGFSSVSNTPAYVRLRLGSIANTQFELTSNITISPTVSAYKWLDAGSEVTCQIQVDEPDTGAIQTINAAIGVTAFEARLVSEP